MTEIERENESERSREREQDKKEKGSEKRKKRSDFLRYECALWHMLYLFFYTVLSTIIFSFFP